MISQTVDELEVIFLIKISPVDGFKTRFPTIAFQSLQQDAVNGWVNDVADEPLTTLRYNHGCFEVDGNDLRNPAVGAGDAEGRKLLDEFIRRLHMDPVKRCLIFNRWALSKTSETTRVNSCSDVLGCGEIALSRPSGSPYGVVVEVGVEGVVGHGYQS